VRPESVPRRMRKRTMSRSEMPATLSMEDKIAGHRLP